MGEKERIAAYFDARAERYLERSQRGLWRWLRKRELLAVSSAVGGKPEESMLDLGCGAGFYAHYFARERGLKVVAVDSSARMLAGLSGRNIRTKLCPIESLQPGEAYDVVLAAGSLEFIADLDRVFRLAFASLRPGGRFVVLAPAPGIRGFLYGLHHRLQGCPVIVRPLAQYIIAAERAGFRPSSLPLRTAISLVLRFDRPA